MIENPDSGLNAAVAAVLRGEKYAQRLTNRQLSERSGIPEVSVQRYLDAKRDLKVDVLAALAASVGLTAGELINAAAIRLGRPDQSLIDSAAAGLEAGASGQQDDPSARQDTPDNRVTDRKVEG